MTAYADEFSSGCMEMNHLLRGKGAKLGEMTRPRGLKP